MQKLAWLWVLLLCMGFEWPGRVAHVKYELAHGDARARRDAVRRLAAYPADLVREPVLTALEDEDTQVRLEAAAAVARAGVHEAAPQLLTWLADRDPGARIAALTAFGSLAEPSAREALTRSLSDALPSVRRAAALALSQVADAEALLALQAAVDDADPSVREAAVLGLRGRADGRVLGTLAKHVRDESAAVRLAVMNALGALRDPRALPPLLQGANDPDEQVALAAVMALGETPVTGDASAIASLRKKLEGPPIVAKAALSALGRIHGQASLGVLIATLANPELASSAKSAIAARLRRRASESVGGREDRERPQLMAALSAALGAGSSPGQINLVADLIGDIHGLFPLTELHGPLLSAQREARGDPARLTRALAFTGAPEALVPLLERLSRLEEQTGPSAELEALLDAMLRYFAAGLADGRATDPLLARLQTAKLASTRAKLVRLIGWTRAVRALPALTAELASPDRAVQLASIDALGRIAAPESLAALQPLLFSPAADIRGAASRAFASGARDSDVRALLSLLDSAAAADRGALLVSLGLALGRLRAAHQLSEATEKLALASLGRWASDLDPRLSAHALGALRRLGHPQAARSFAREFRSPRASRRAAATFALADFPADETRRLLRFVLHQHSAPRVSMAAVLALGEVGDQRDVPALLRTAHYNPWPLPAATAYALRRLSEREDVKKRSFERGLCGLLDEPNTYARANLVVALAALGGSCPERDLLAWLAPGEPSAVRTAVARWLRSQHDRPEQPDPKRAELLARCAGDPDPQVSAACSGLPLEPGYHPIDVVAYDADGETLLTERLVALRLADASVFVGYTDANGRVQLPAAPKGEVLLEDPGDVP